MSGEAAMTIERATIEQYATNWEWLETQKPRPTFYKGFISEDFTRFVGKIQAGDVEFQRQAIRALYGGHLWVLRNAFTADFIKTLRARTIRWMQANPSGFHKMLEGSPDFHRVITPEKGKKYAFQCCKHSAYFYNWNTDPLGIKDEVYRVWRPMKLLMGHKPDKYEHNTPKDGVVDRIQVVRYPPGDGMLATHADPFLHQRCFVSGIMSKRGVDYHGGGFYLMNRAGEKVSIEDDLNVGDVVIGYATVHHGVDPCEGICDWDATDGRWFLSMYSNASDEVKHRHTGRAV